MKDRRASQTAKPGFSRRRMTLLAIAICCVFLSIGGQLVRLGMKGAISAKVHAVAALGASTARPDIVDRNGHLLAMDLVKPSLYANPSQILDLEEVLDRLSAEFPDFDRAALRKKLSDRRRQFEWVRRGLTPSKAQRIHNLGLPGLHFRNELRRAYPLGRTTAHLIGHVDIDNRGRAGVERFIDERVGVETVVGAARSSKPPVRLTLDIRVQHGLRQELLAAMGLYNARAAAGLVLDINSGAILAGVSLPDYDPRKGGRELGKVRRDRLQHSIYEFGSVYKAVTMAMVLDAGVASRETIVDASEPIRIGRFKITDFHGRHRPLTLDEVFLYSSNIGAARLADLLGKKRQKHYLKQLGLLDPLVTDVGPLARPQIPKYWGRVHMMTISYGHGIAEPALQFAAAAASLVNGGIYVRPTLVLSPGTAKAGRRRRRVFSRRTSEQMRALWRLNVISGKGTGKRADVPGYAVGGKTGTADIAGKGGYRKRATIASFIAAFPMNSPRYLTFVVLFQPTPRTAGLTAAPTTRRLIRRIAPMLGVLPQGPAPRS